MKIALQLWSVRDACAQDFFGTIKAVAAMGYEGVEFAGYFDQPAAEIRKVLDGCGLKVAGTHIGLDSLTGDALKKTLEFNRTIGNKYLVVPGLPAEMTNSKAAWLKTAQLFNDVVKNTEKEGVFPGYHNHMTEFQKYDGQYAFDIFFGATVPGVVAQLDTGNALQGKATNADLLGFAIRYKNRLKTVHLKEFSAVKENALLGDGEVNFKEFISACAATGGTEWLIVEKERYLNTPLEDVKKSLENLRKLI